MSSWIISRKLLYPIIFFSGIAALIYELIWVRLMDLTFGVSSFAVATVVSVFMLGIGLGSIIFGKKSEKSINVLKTYAYLELGIGLASIFSFILLQYTPIFDFLFLRSYNNLDLYTLSIVRFIIAALILIPTSIGIGGTIPLLAKYLIRTNNKLGSQFSIIYYFNTLGALIGVFLTGFFLVQYFGVTATFFIAVLINIIIFLIITLFGRRSIKKVPAREPESSVEEPGYNVQPVKNMLIILFLTGFIAFGYELLWIRVLTNFGSATTFSFTLILGGFIAGLALGSLYVARIIDRIKNPLKHFSAYSIIAGVLGAIILFIFSKLYIVFPELTGIYQRFLIESWIGFGLSLIIATIIGTLFPLGVKLYAGSKEVIGRKTGKVYLVNSLGTIAGSLATGFIFIPWLGIKNTAIILITLSFLIATYLIIKKIHGKKNLAILLSFSIIISLIILINTGNTFHRFIKDDVLLYYAEGLSATVTVYQRHDDGQVYKQLNVDSQPIAGTHPTNVIDAKILAHLPLLLVDKPNTALTVGYGSGGTSYSMLLHNIEVYALEIEQKVVEASKKFRELNNDAESNPSLHLIIDDARNYLKNINKNFDAIVTDVTNLKYKSNPYLYTKDYFQIIKNKLYTKGVAAAWVPLGGLSFEDLKTLISSFQAVYPHSTLWYFNKEPTGFLLLVGTPDQLNISLDNLKERFSPIAADLENIGVENEYELASMLLLGENDIRRLVHGVRPHTDDKPILEFSDLKYYATYNPFDNLEKLLDYQKEMLKPYFKLTSEQDNILLEEFWRARVLMKHYINEHK